MTIPQNVCIQGTLNINLADYQFTTSFLNMGPGSFIRIPFNNTLVVENTSIYGCQDMWGGINILPGGEFDVTSSTIRDAETGILANFGTTLTAQNNTFENNRIGIHAIRPLLNFFPGVSLPVPISGNTLRTNGSLLAGGLGFAGVEMTNLKGFTVGTTNGAASPNVFDNLENGIVAHRSVFGVHGATFRNMPDVGTLIPLIPRGYGIFAENRSFAHVTNCSFEALSTAIHGTDSSLDVFDNVVNSNTLQGAAVAIGIRAVGSFNNTRIDVHDNTVSSLRFGMLFIEMGNANIFDIVDNTINVGDPAVDPVFSGFSGIQVANSDFTSTNRGLIANNTINQFAARDGINLLDCSYINVLNNDIIINPPIGTAVLNGILTTYSQQLSVRNNSVLASNPNGPRGLIAVGTTSSGFCCNTFNGNATSVIFDGTCTGTSFRGNVLGNSNIGLLYNSNATTGPQDRAGNLWPGTYTDVGARHAGNLQTIQSSRYFVNPSVAFAWPPSIDPQFFWFVAVSASGTYNCQGHFICEKHIEIPQDTLSADHLIAKGNRDSGLEYQSTLDWEGERYLFEKLDKNQDLMQGQPLFQTFYNSKLGTTVERFNDIQDDIAALADVSPSEMAQYQTNQASLATYLHDLAAIDSQLYAATEPLLSTLRAQRDALLDNMAYLEVDNDSLLTIIHNARLPLIQQIITANNAIFTAEVFEQNEKELNDVWLNTIAQGIYSFTPTQTATLEGIIYQCPNYGSHAVRRARALYSLITFQEYDDDLLCTPPQQLQGNGNVMANTTASSFKLYPNPANDRINLILGKDVFDEGGGIQITDITGKIVLEHSLPEGQRMHSINLDGLAKGTYFCKVLSNNKQVYVQTLVITH